MRTLWALLLVLVLAMGFRVLMSVHGAQAVPTPAVAAEVLRGPSCTPIYPRGFQVTKGTKKKPLDICKGGDLQSAWGKCHTRFYA